MTGWGDVGGGGCDDRGWRPVVVVVVVIAGCNDREWGAVVGCDDSGWGAVAIVVVGWDNCVELVLSHSAFRSSGAKIRKKY